MGTGLGVRIDLDALMAFPVEEVERVLAATGRGSRRKRKLPAHVMVYYVIALGLLASVGAREVLRRVIHREEQGFTFTLATDAAISKARQRLGWTPLKALFEQYVRPIATRRMSWAWFKGRRLVALDGSTLNVIDSRDNVRTFGKPPSSRGKRSLLRYGGWRWRKSERTCCSPREWLAGGAVRTRWGCNWCGISR